MAQVEQIIKIRVQSKDAEKQLDSLQLQINANKEAQKNLNAAYKNGEVSAKDYARSSRLLKEESKALGSEQRQLTKETRATAGSYNDLSAQMARLKKEQKNVNVSTKAGRAEFDRYAQEINATNDQLKELDESNGVHVRNVGNYKNAIVEASQELNIMGVNVGGLQQQFSKTTGIISASTKGLKGLRLALASTGIGAIVIALGALITYFTQTKDGSEKLQVALSYLQGAFTVLKGLVADFGRGMVNAFTSPKEALKSFYTSLKTFVIDAFKKVMDGAGLLGSSIKKLFSGDFAGAMEDAKNGTVALVDGLTDLNPVTAIIKEVTKETIELGKEINKTAKESANIKKLEIAYKDLRREVELNLATLRSEAELKAAISDDDTLSFAEREKASDEARKKLQEVAEQELRLANLQLEISQRNLAQARKNGVVTDALLDAELEAKKQVLDAENNLMLARFDNDAKRRKLQSDILERDLDFSLDSFDNTKSINERIIADETKTFAERQALLQQTKALGDKAFADQISTVQTLTEETIDANDLINESNGTVLKEKVRALGLSEIMEGRLLEIIRDRKTAIQDLSEAEMSLSDEATAKVEANEKKKADAAVKAARERVEAVSNAESNINDIVSSATAFFEASKAAQLKAAGNSAKKREQIERSFARKEKAIAISQAIINGALAVSKVLAQTGVASPLAIPLIVAQTAGQIAVISSQEFANGGMVDYSKGGIGRGPSHAGGGIQMFSKGGQHRGEFEGKEAIIAKKPTAMFKPILSAMNVAGGGKAFANGGVNSNIPTSTNNRISDMFGMQEIVKRINDIKVVQELPTAMSGQNELNALTVNNKFA